MISMARTSLMALLIVIGAYCTKSHAADASIVGSWRLVSWVEVETESKSVHTAFGENPTGVITYTPDGRMSCVYHRPETEASSRSKTNRC